MSSQRGNVARTRTQKYQNARAFKNDMHDKSSKIKMINNLCPEGICHRCKEIIEWKIKYKKYKPLSQPATCVRCHDKTVKRAYYTVCQPCATEAKVCAKCNTKQENIVKPGPSEQEKMLQDGQLKFELKQLKERQRRSFFRHIEKGESPSVALEAASATLDEKSFDGDETTDDDETSNDEEYCRS